MRDEDKQRHEEIGLLDELRTRVLVEPFIPPRVISFSRSWITQKGLEGKVRTKNYTPYVLYSVSSSVGRWVRNLVQYSRDGISKIHIAAYCLSKPSTMRSSNWIKKAVPASIIRPMKWLFSPLQGSPKWANFLRGCLQP